MCSFKNLIYNHQVQGWIVMLYDDSWGFAKLFGDLTGKHGDLSSKMYGYRNMDLQLIDVDRGWLIGEFKPH